jgi:hypothetical protein
VLSTPTDLKRFSQVPLDSSAARRPLPFATIAAAVLESNALSIRILGVEMKRGAERGDFTAADNPRPALSLN